MTQQARTLLNAVNTIQRLGPHLVAFFGVMYYSALRSEEAINLRKHNLALPKEGWGELILERTAPEAGKAWTDTGTNRDDRGLKHRARDEIRPVPSPPELTALLHAHLTTEGTDDEGRLFRADRGGTLNSSSYTRIWQRARQLAFTPDVAASPLARRPYDLRHAAVSTWLNGGVPPTQVAEWAGHSVAVLLRVYAKCISGHEHAARARVQAALGHR